MKKQNHQFILAGFMLILGAFLALQLCFRSRTASSQTPSRLEVRLATAMSDAGIRVKWAEDILAADIELRVGPIRERIIAFMKTSLIDGAESPYNSEFFVQPAFEQPETSGIHPNPSTTDRVASPKVLRETGQTSSWLQSFLAGEIRFTENDSDFGQPTLP